MQMHARAAVLLPEKLCISKESPYVIASPNQNDSVCSCVVPELKPSNSHFRIKVDLRGHNRNASVAAMVDCGATALFIGDRFVKEN